MVSSPVDSLEASMWIVGFFDMLGYRAILDGLDKFPLPEDPQGQADLASAIGRAVKSRRRFRGQVDAFNKGLSASETDTFPEGLPAELREKLAAWREVQIIRTTGPDHWVIAASLAPVEGHTPMRAVYHLMTSAGAAMLIQLAMGADDPDLALPLRGGISIGAGMHLPEDDFLYSPALTRAYELESKTAIVPRTLICERVAGYIAAWMKAEPQSPIEAYTRHLAQGISGFIFEDKDGHLALDFFGPQLRSAMDDGTDECQKLAKNAWTFATSALQGARDRGDEKVSKNYEWLVEYMRPRLHHWGVEA